MSDLTATNCGCGCNEVRSNGCNSGCGSIIWILILLMCCGGCGNSGWGGNGGCGDNSCLLILLLLFCCGGFGCNDGCGC